MMFAVSSVAKEISGTVHDRDGGGAIPGAVVRVEGTIIGAVTDADGGFILRDVPEDAGKITIQIIGYRTAEIPAGEGVVKIELVPAPFNVGEIVVTATGTERIFEDVPVKTEIIPQRRIQALQEPDLMGALSYSPGLRVENNCQNCSFTQLRMLGLEGSYTQVLIDGDPVMSVMAGVYGLQQFPRQMIDKIEIVKGGGSSLYGGNAIGGVVDIRLRRPVRNSSSVNFNHRIGDRHVKNEFGFVSERVSEDMRFGMYVFGNARKQNAYDRNGDGFSDIGYLNGESLGFNMYYKPRDDGELRFHLHRIHEDRRGGNNLSHPSHQADISEAAESYRWGGNLKYIHTPRAGLIFEGNYSFALASRDTYYGGGQDPNAYGSTDNPLHFVSGKTIWRTGANTLSGGVTYSSERLFDKAVAYGRVIDEDYNDLGVFIQDEIEFAGRYTVVGGVRMDRHSLLDDPVFSPRLSGLVKLTDNLKLRAGVSTGFKAPQIFDEDLHITIVGGEGHVYRNASDLKEERSVSYSATLDYLVEVAERPVQAGVTGFHTVLDDQFQLVERDDTATSAVEFERVNGDGLRVSGVELQFGIKPLPSLELHTGWTFQTDELDSPEPDFGSRRLFRTPERYGNLMAFYDPTSRVSVFGGINYTGEMKAPHYAGYIENDHLDTTDPFVTVDLGFSLALPVFGGSSKINAGVKNLADSYQKDLDKGADRDAGYIYGPVSPRMFYVGIEHGI